jgi:predicted RNase H-like HicB family nuclease
VEAYRVAYERNESGWWVATVRGVRGCHTQGRTVDEARRLIRKALELFVDDARKAPIVDDVKLPTAAGKGDSGVRESSQEGRRRGPTRSTCGSTCRASPAQRTPEDERTRRRAAAGPVAPAGPSAHRGRVGEALIPLLDLHPSDFVMARRRRTSKQDFRRGGGADNADGAPVRGFRH